MIPERTMRSRTSPVERTSISSRWASGHFNISVSSMCITNRAGCVVSGSRSEFDPCEFPRLDCDLTIHALGTDCDTQHVNARRDIRDAEVLVIDGIAVIAPPVRFDE